MVTKTTTKKQTAAAAAAHGLDWSLRPRGTASAVGTAVLGMTAGAAVGNLCGLPPALGIGAGLIGMASTVATSSVALGTRALVWRSLVWLAGGGWASWGLASGVWEQPQVAALALGALAAGMTAPLGRAQDIDEAAADGAATATAGAEAAGLAPVHGGGTTGLTWAAYIRRATRVVVTVTDVTEWDNGGGFTLTALLPVTGTATVDTIKACANVLATLARLPLGCGVTVSPGTHRGEVVLRVSTVNRMEETVSFPEDYSPLSINRPLPLGLYPDSDTVQVLLRELSMLIVGTKGSGKTNLMDLITLLLLRCTDTLVWHLDLNGGGMSQMWLNPWLEGEVDRPAIDWAAATEDEALLMVRTAMVMAKNRKRTGRKLKIAANSKLLPISRELPAIVIMVDEGKNVLSDRVRGKAAEVGKGLQVVMDQARNEGVNIVASGLRATTDAIRSEFKALCGLRVGMRVEQESELSHLLGWGRLDMSEIPTKGCAFIREEGSTPRAFKSALLPPDQIVRAARILADAQPALDEATASVSAQIQTNDDPNDPEYASAADIYARRWERMKATFTALEDGGDEDEDEDDGPMGLVHRRLQSIPAGRTSGWGDAQELRRAARELLPDTSAPAAPPVLKAVRVPAAAAPARPAQEVPQLLTAAINAFGRDTRMHSDDLAAALGLPNKHRLAELLGALEVYPLPNAFSRGGQERRGYERKDLEAAARAITDGAQDVPEAVSAWAS